MYSWSTKITVKQQRHCCTGCITNLVTHSIDSSVEHGFIMSPSHNILRTNALSQTGWSAKYQKRELRWGRSCSCHRLLLGVRRVAPAADSPRHYNLWFVIGCIAVHELRLSISLCKKLISAWIIVLSMCLPLPNCLASFGTSSSCGNMTPLEK